MFRSQVVFCGMAFLIGCNHSGNHSDFATTGYPILNVDQQTDSIITNAGITDTQLKPIDPKKPLELSTTLPGLKEIDKPGPTQFPSPPSLHSKTIASGQPLGLATVEQLALQKHPAIQQAAADVEIARGKARQAGLLPNPTFGFVGDNFNSGEGNSTRGQPGAFVEFTIPLSGKLRLETITAELDCRNAELALRKSQLEILGKVRANYFAVLVAEESVRVNQIIAQIAEQLYKTQVGLVKGAEQAAYEPLQTYSLVLKSRTEIVQARDRYLSAWRQLAASIGQPDLPPAPIHGRADLVPPKYDFATLRSTAFKQHTELFAANNLVLQARYNLRLAELAPIPDLRTEIYVERDWSTPPYNAIAGIKSGVQVPIFNRNLGNIYAAKANLARVLQEPQRIQNEITKNPASALENYDNSYELVEIYRNELIPNQARVYRAITQRYNVDPDKVSFSDIGTAQQDLVDAFRGYLDALNKLWSSITELSNIAQLEELYLPNSADTSSVTDILNHSEPRK